METKTFTPDLSTRRVKTKQISYKQLAELLLNLQIEVTLLADTIPEEGNSITATNCTSPGSIMYHFEDTDFSLSLDLIRKGGIE